MKALLPLTLAAVLAGCAAGPDYRRPEPQPAATAGFVDPGAATVASTAAADPNWWRLFGDPNLDRLIADALQNNTDVRVAAANLQRARAFLSEARNARLPTTDVSASYTRQRVGLGNPAAGGGATGAPGGPDAVTFDYFSLGFDAAYEVDLFGRVSRSIEAARGERDAAAAGLDDARVSVAAETARAYAQACGFALRAQVARDTATLQERTRDLTRRLLEGGRGTQREVDQATVLAETARAQVPLFEAERRAALYALAALTGRPPAEVDGAAAVCAAPPRVATLIPIGDGAQLLARRPDVRRAERQLAADTARIGVATASLYPSISLLGGVSLGAENIGDLGKGSSFGFSLGPLISWSFPNLGAGRARVRAAEATAAASLAAFDGTVLTALREVEQALARYAGALDRNAALTRADQAAASAANIARLRFDSGRDSFIQLLDAERERASARAALAESQSAVAEAQVSLFKALGGGWETAAAEAAGR